MTWSGDAPEGVAVVAAVVAAVGVVQAPDNSFGCGRIYHIRNTSWQEEWDIPEESRGEVSDEESATDIRPRVSLHDGRRHRISQAFWRQCGHERRRGGCWRKKRRKSGTYLCGGKRSV